MFGPSPFEMNPMLMCGINPMTSMGMSPTMSMNPMLIQSGMSMAKDAFYENKIRNLEEELNQKNEENKLLKDRLNNSGVINVQHNYSSMNPIMNYKTSDQFKNTSFSEPPNITIFYLDCNDPPKSKGKKFEDNDEDYY